MSIVAPTDFIGIYRISQQNFTTADLTAYINQYENSYLADLFGAQLYSLFIADLVNGVPVSERFTNVFNPFVLSNEVGEDSVNWSTFHVGHGYDPYFPFANENGSDRIHQSFGIKDMLTGFMYLDFNVNQPIQPSPAGMQIPQQDVSKKADSGTMSARLANAYNRAIDSYRAIQWYMNSGPNTDQYREFRGVCKEKMYMGGAI